MVAVVNPTASLSFQDILSVEDTEELLDIRCEVTELPLWPLVRNHFFRVMFSDLFYKGSIHTNIRSHHVRFKAVSTMARSVVHNLKASAKAPGGVCIMASGMGLQKQNGLWFNRLSDHFALSAPQVSCLIEDQFHWEWPFPRSFSNVMFHAPYQAAGAVWGRLGTQGRHRNQAEQVIELVAGRAKERFGWCLAENSRTMLTRKLAARAAALPFMYSTYTRLLASTRAKLLLKEEACYGGSAVVVAAARSLGMVVAEYQHGAITSGHDAYNFAPAVLNSKAYGRCLPEYFLSHGQWWNQQINAPVKKIAIGNPHRDTILSNVDRSRAKPNILLIGDGVDTQVYLKLATDLVPAAARLGLQVVFRPHPFERHLFEDESQTIANVEIDSRGEIYDSLARARAIVSESSTVLFEASGLADMIFVWETPKSRFNLPSHPFEGVAGAEEIALKLSAAKQVEPRQESGMIWADGWRQNYLAFLEELEIAPV